MGKGDETQYRLLRVTSVMYMFSWARSRRITLSTSSPAGPTRCARCRSCNRSPHLLHDEHVGERGLRALEEEVRKDARAALRWQSGSVSSSAPSRASRQLMLACLTVCVRDWAQQPMQMPCSPVRGSRALVDGQGFGWDDRICPVRYQRSGVA